VQFYGGKLCSFKAEKTGAEVIQQYLNLGVVDELEIALVPVLFGSGRRLFENLHEPLPQFRIDRVVEGAAATHLRYVRE